MGIFAEIERVREQERLRAEQARRRKSLVDAIIPQITSFSHDDQVLIIGALAEAIEAPVKVPAAESGESARVAEPMPNMADEQESASATPIVRKILMFAKRPMTPAEIVEAVHAQHPGIPRPHIYSAVNKRSSAGEFEAHGPPKERTYTFKKVTNGARTR